MQELEVSVRLGLPYGGHDSQNYVDLEIEDCNSSLIILKLSIPADDFVGLLRGAQFKATADAVDVKNYSNMGKTRITGKFDVPRVLVQWSDKRPNEEMQQWAVEHLSSGEWHNYDSFRFQNSNDGWKLIVWRYEDAE